MIVSCFFFQLISCASEFRQLCHFISTAEREHLFGVFCCSGVAGFPCDFPNYLNVFYWNASSVDAYIVLLFDLSL